MLTREQILEVLNGLNMRCPYFDQTVGETPFSCYTYSRQIITVYYYSVGKICFRLLTAGKIRQRQIDTIIVPRLLIELCTDDVQLLELIDCWFGVKKERIISFDAWCDRYDLEIAKEEFYKMYRSI